ncbi:MAG TPA: THUMP domain-containing protein, partial [Saprospiraceae bacterium]|nr:THUMP domain-containing protein [Saprospiraceae bacterium]
MNIFQDTSRILISCQKMLGTALASEVKALGYETVNETPSVVEIQGTMDDCFILNLHLRTASQVLYHIRSFHAENAEELYQKARNIYWEDILLPDVYFSITGYVNNETVNNSMYANVKLKDAIV